MLYDFALGMAAGAGAMMLAIVFRVQEEIRKRRTLEQQLKKLKRMYAIELSNRMCEKAYDDSINPFGQVTDDAQR